MAAGPNKRSVTIEVRVVPRASKGEVVGFHDGALKVRIAAPPVDGAANAELIKLLAKTFSIPRPSITILAGANAKTKRVRIDGLDDADVKERLSNFLS